MIRALFVATVTVLFLPGAAIADAPVLSLPADMTVEAEGPDGAVATFTATATKGSGDEVPVTCVPASGSVFPLGATVVECSAAVDDDETLSGSFTVTVTDTTAPVFAGAVSATVEALDADGAPVAYTAPVATDAVDGPVPVDCAPTSGSLFGLGTTEVTCSAVDSRGNRASSAGAVAVVDTTPPTLTVPAPLALTAATAAGIDAADPRLAAFLAGAVATDMVTARPAVATDAPAVFPVGTTVVTFTATDEAGNASSATATVTVAPPPPAGAPSPPPAPPPAPGPPAAADRTPPGNPLDLRARSAARTVVLTWRPPSDGDLGRFEVFRSVASRPAASAVRVYAGTARTFTDRGLRSGVQYRYVVVSVDQAGNRSSGAAVTALPAAKLLLAPSDGKRVFGPPRLAWVRARGATFYNVQLYRGRTKVLTAWPKTNRYRLRSTWRFDGRRIRLTPGTYRWYVWPGRGPWKAARYGELLGSSTFVVRRR